MMKIIEESSTFTNHEQEKSVLSNCFHEESTPHGMSGIQINVEEASNDGHKDVVRHIETTAVATDSPLSWHIPRPSLGCPKAGRIEKDSENGSWAHHHHHHHHHHHLHPDSPSRGSTSSQGSTASTHSAASGTLLLTAANLANLAAMHPPTVTTPKQMDTASVASSTHFTVVNGLGRPTTVYRKSWCARNQLTVLVCTMSFLFMVGLLAGILFMEMRARDKYN
ncbi:TSC22 domain family protein 1 [Vespa velutina]|uniref:TSC22 domain family protein 1 n=1 Tax=Vespa velutina TaxID=202808 RepID=UPI001FB32117|nr:TSC22 domain family protein 1 [Vespa velutina]